MVWAPLAGTQEERAVADHDAVRVGLPEGADDHAMHRYPIGARVQVVYADANGRCEAEGITLVPASSAG